MYDNVQKCQPQYNKMVDPKLRDLLDKIFVSDPETRISIEQMKQHKVFEEFDFSVSMTQRFKASGPFIPDEPTYFERADRDSEKMKEAVKPKNLLAAIMGNPQALDAQNAKNDQKNFEFDHAHYDKFEREVKKVQDEADLGGAQAQPQVPRRRQNPLGDFKFRRINELF